MHSHVKQPLASRKRSLKRFPDLSFTHTGARIILTTLRISAAQGWLARLSAATLVSVLATNPSLAEDRVVHLEASPYTREKSLPPGDKAAYAQLRAQNSAMATLATHMVVRKTQKNAGKRERTRFVIGLPQRTQYDVFTLRNPNRVIVDLNVTRLRLPEQPKGNAIGLIKGFRAGISGPGRSRIVIDLVAPAVLVSAKLEAVDRGDGHLLVMDLAPFSELASHEAKARDSHLVRTEPLCIGILGNLVDQ